MRRRQAGSLALLLLAPFAQLLEEGAALLLVHFVDARGLLGWQAAHHGAHALLRFGWQVVDPARACSTWWRCRWRGWFASFCEGLCGLPRWPCVG